MPKYVFLKIFLAKTNCRKIGAFCSNYLCTASVCLNFEHNIGFYEKRQFFAENCDHM
jgi:hypothetical protein